MHDLFIRVSQWTYTTEIWTQSYDLKRRSVRYDTAFFARTSDGEHHSRSDWRLLSRQNLHLSTNAQQKLRQGAHSDDRRVLLAAVCSMRRRLARPKKKKSLGARPGL
jgi:hypothetical protein